MERKKEGEREKWRRFHETKRHASRALRELQDARQILAGVKAAYDEAKEAYASLEACYIAARDEARAAREAVEGDVLVTAHAVVRFLERERGVDMEEVRALVRRRPGTALATDQDVLQYLSRDVGISISSVRSAILTPALLAAIDERGGRAGTYPLTDRCRARVADHTVITILLKEE